MLQESATGHPSPWAVAESPCQALRGTTSESEFAMHGERTNRGDSGRFGGARIFNMEWNKTGLPCLCDRSYAWITMMLRRKSVLMLYVPLFTVVLAGASLQRYHVGKVTAVSWNETGKARVDAAVAVLVVCWVSDVGGNSIVWGSGSEVEWRSGKLPLSVTIFLRWIITRAKSSLARFSGITARQFPFSSYSNKHNET